MALTLLGLLVSVACVYASLKRLRFAAEPTALDPNALLSMVRVPTPRAERALWAAFLAETADDPTAQWERDLLEALAAPASSRVALVNQELSELDFRARRWCRVPRVCAGISTSFGFLLALLAICSALTSDSRDVSAATLVAINAITVGLASAAFCAAAHLRAGTMVHNRLVATDKLVERLQGLAAVAAVLSETGETGDKSDKSDKGGQLPRLPELEALV